MSQTSAPRSVLSSLRPLTKAIDIVTDGITESYNAVGATNWFSPKDPEKIYDITEFAQIIGNVLSSKDPGNGIARTGDINVLVQASDVMECLHRALDERTRTLPDAFIHGQKMTKTLTGLSKQNTKPGSKEDGLLYELICRYLQRMLTDTKK